MDFEYASLRNLAHVHDSLEQLLDELVEAVAATDRARITPLRTRFDRELLSHFAHEEQFFIPAIARLSERDARAIVLEHRDLTTHWSEVCLALEREVSSRATMDAFADGLRAHARNEDEILQRLAADQ